MSEDTTIVSFSRSGFEDQLSEMLQRGARRLLAEAIEGEFAGFMAHYAGLRGGAQRLSAGALHCERYEADCRESAQDTRPLGPWDRFSLGSHAAVFEKLAG